MLRPNRPECRIRLSSFRPYHANKRRLNDLHVQIVQAVWPILLDSLYTSQRHGRPSGSRNIYNRQGSLDRLIIAQARITGLPLITGDERSFNPAWFVPCGIRANAQIVFRRLDEAKSINRWNVGNFWNRRNFPFLLYSILSAFIRFSRWVLCMPRTLAAAARLPSCEQALF